MCIVRHDGTMEPLCPMECKHRYVVVGRNLHEYTEPEKGPGTGSTLQRVVQRVTKYLIISRESSFFNC